MARRITYTREAWTPQPPPNLVINEAWGEMQDPIFTQTVLYPHFSYCPHPPFTLPVTPAQNGFDIKWQDPVRVPARATEISIAFCPQPPPSLPVTPTQLGFLLQWQEPVRVPGRAQDSPFAWEPQVVTTSAPNGWAAVEAQVVRTPARAPDPVYIWQPQKLNLPVTPSIIGWDAKWQDPVRLRQGATEISVAFDPEKEFVAVIAPPNGWAATQFSATLLPPRAVDPQFSWNPQALNLPITPSQFGFYRPFADPVRTLDRRDSVFAWTPQPIATSPIQFGWYVPFLDPIKNPARPPESVYIWDPEQIILPVTPAQFGWYTPWRDPAPIPRTSASQTAWTSISFTSPVLVDWLVTPYQSDVPSLVCATASTVPALVCLRGACVENETYMSYLLPLTIQQPFALFPGNGIPIMWQVILGSTWNSSQTPVTDCTGTLEVIDSSGEVVYTVPFTNQGNGLYQAMINGPTFNPTPGNNYTTVISLTSPTVAQPGVWSIPTFIRGRNTP